MSHEFQNFGRLFYGYYNYAFGFFFKCGSIKEVLKKMACSFQVEVQTQDRRLETTNGDQWQKGHLSGSSEIKKNTLNNCSVKIIK